MTDQGKKKSHAEIIDRIKKFLSMTVERGAGESEALFAARKAAELMAEYDISLADLKDKPRTTDGVYQKYPFDPQFSRYVFEIADAVGELCNVRVLISGPGKGEVTIIGLELDAAIAEYLLSICVHAMRYEAEKASKAWELKALNHRMRSRAAFLQGMSKRLKERLRELSWARRKASNGTTLVVVTDKMVDDLLAIHGMHRAHQPIRFAPADPEMLRLGRSAGDRTALNNAVEERSATSAQLDDRDEELAGD